MSNEHLLLLQTYVFVALSLRAVINATLSNASVCDFMDDGGGYLSYRCLWIHDERVIKLALAPSVNVLGKTAGQRYNEHTLQVPLNLGILSWIDVSYEPKGVDCACKQRALVKLPTESSNPDVANPLAGRQSISEPNTGGPNHPSYCTAKDS
jgi:hypothetical protein